MANIDTIICVTPTPSSHSPVDECSGSSQAINVHVAIMTSDGPALAGSIRLSQLSWLWPWLGRDGPTQACRIRPSSLISGAISVYVHVAIMMGWDPAAAGTGPAVSDITGNSPGSVVAVLARPGADSAFTSPAAAFQSCSSSSHGTRFPGRRQTVNYVNRECCVKLAQAQL
jgi:hypothetical protein